jgi:chitinase
MSLLRRDTDKTSVRLDYATFGNYWDTFVDSPGEGQEKASNLMKRYWSNETSNWESLSSDNEFAWSSGAPISIKEDLTKLLWWQTDKQCDVGGTDYNEAFAAYVDGSIDAKMHYGFSLYGNFEASGELNIESAHGFVNAAGKSDLTYAITGFGTVDVPSADKGNPAQGGTKTVSLKGSKIRAGAKDFYVNFEPYLKATYEMASFNGSQGSDSDFSDSVANFDGRLSARVVQDFSNITAYWPSDDPDSIKPPSGSYKDLEISIPVNGDNLNRLYYTDGHGGSIALGTDLNFGVKISMQHVTYTPPALEGGSSSPNRKTTDIGTMALRYNTFTHFSFSPSDSPDEACSDIQITSDAFQDPGYDSLLTDAGWGSAIDSLGKSSEMPAEGGVCYSKFRIPSSSNSKRDQHQSATDCPTCSLTPGPEDSFNNSSLTDESPSHNQQNSRRDYTASFPGFEGDWEYKAAKAAKIPPLWQLLPDSLKDRIRGSTDAIFKPPSDSSCLKTNTTAKKKLPCCGCVPMDWTYSYSDIPPYDYCDSCPSSGNLFTWPYGKLRDKDLIYKRNLDVDSTHELVERDESRGSDGFPRLSKKKVSICGRLEAADDDGRYPAFPKNASYGWDGIENGRWDTISKYWGNTSESCWDWGVADLFPHDKRAIPADNGGGLVRADYESKFLLLPLALKIY